MNQQYVRDHARQEWVDTPASRSITVHPPTQTRPVGFVIPEQPKPQPLSAPAFGGGWTASRS